MKKKSSLILAGILFISFFIINPSKSQNRVLSLDQAITDAKNQSLMAFMYKHRFRRSYWQYRSYKADYLPSVSAQSNIFNLNRSISKNNVLEGGQWIEKYAETKSLNSSLGISVSQKIPWTGGRISMSSNINRNDRLDGDPVNWMTSPIGISLTQPLFSFNEFKWERITAPMDYEIAKKNYIEGMEDVTIQTITRFFDLLRSQENLKAARKNRNKRDTLYLIATGRFEMGVIGQADLMEMEQQYLIAKNKVINDSLSLQVVQQRFSTFMGYRQAIEFELVYDTILPTVIIDVNHAIDLAKENGSEWMGFEVELMNSDMNLSRTKAQNRFNADLRLSYGLTQQGSDFFEAYQDPRNSQGVSMSMSIPIFDWGRRKGQIKMAESSKELTRIQVEQSQQDFEHNFFLQVSRFNLMGDQFLLSAKTDSISELRFEITMQQYLNGQIDILKLNDAIDSKDRAKLEYVSTLSQFWTEYYAIRKATLYDFLTNSILTADFDLIIE